MQKFKGTFQPNKNKRIHSWYPYLAGFSAELVQDKINEYGLNESHKIFDPFAGVGTTLLVAKENNIPSEGTEINPFVSYVANTKLFQKYNNLKLENEFKKIEAYESVYANINLNESPSLIRRAFSDKILIKLLSLKKRINLIDDEDTKKLFLLALISILKEVSNCKNFSPYIEMKSQKLNDADVYRIYLDKLNTMIVDVSKFNNNTFAKVYNKDTRDLSFLENKYDLVVTSPPYLNNWDYSWITRIELYFLEYAKNSKEITELLRNKLVKSSTYVLQNVEKEGILNIPESEVKKEINKIISKLKEIRTKKGSSSKKYDITVRAYFNDVFKILTQLYKILNHNAPCLWVVGDSALYGVHVKTDYFIGKIGEQIGFKFEKLDILRKRSATRHKIELQESIVVLKR